MALTTWRSLDDRLRDVVAPDLGLDALVDAVYAEVARYVPYSFACLATTDPATGVVTWASKTRSLGVGDEEFSALEYGPPDINKFEDIAARTPPVGALWLDTDGHPELCRRFREFLQPRFGFTDELRVVFASRGAVWGALSLSREDGVPFTRDETLQVAGIGATVAAAIQRCLFRSGPVAATAGSPHVESAGPAVLIVDSDDRVLQATPAAWAVVSELGGLDHGSLPANVLAVIASARFTDASFSSRVLGTEGRWLSVRAGLLDGGTPGERDVVVSIEATAPAAVSRMALAAHGLTAREEEVALLVTQGLSTRDISSTLHLSPHTVQDHLKVVFTKVGVRSRRELTAALLTA